MDIESVSHDEIEALNELAKLDGATVPPLASEEYLKKIENFEEFGEPEADNKTEAQTNEINEVENMNEETMQTNEVAVNEVAEEMAPAVEAAPSQETTPVLPVQENNPEQGEGLTKTAEVFGVSKAEIEDEFKRYKADRLFSKVILDLTNVDMSYKEALRQLSEASAYKIYGAIVLPNFLPHALKAEPALALNVAVGYPYGVETIAVKKYMIKQVAKKKVAGAIMYVDSAVCKEMKKRVLAKELKKLKMAAGKKNFAIAIDISKFTTEELQNISEAVIQAGITNIVALANFKTGVIDEYGLVRLCGMGKDKFDVIASAPVGVSEKVVNLYDTGVAKFACENAIELAKSFKHQLGI